MIVIASSRFHQKERDDAGPMTSSQRAAYGDTAAVKSGAR